MQKETSKSATDIGVRIGNWISPKLNKIEKFTVIILLIALILKMIFIPLGNFVFILSLIVLADLYFFESLAETRDENAGGIERYIYKLANMSLTIGLIGILFRLERWPVWNVPLTVGTILPAISLLIIFILKSRKKGLIIFSQRLILRIIIIVVIGIILLNVSNETLVKNRLVDDIESQSDM